MKNKRRLALDAGDVYYFTGKLCKQGHVAPKRAINGCCLKCEEVKNNRQDRKQYMAEYAETKRTKMREIASRWQKNNKGKVNANTAKRHAAKMQRTPDWLTKEQLKQIEVEYMLAQWCSEVMQQPYHVDHIVPLQGDNVCGLHVPWNLQVIPATDNIRKKNRFNG